MTRSSRRRIIVVAVLVALNGAVLFMISPRHPADSAKPDHAVKTSPSSASGLRTVEVVSVHSRMLDRKAKLPGELQPYLSVDLYPKVSGILTWIGVDRGSEVKQGELLARLTAPELAMQRQEAEAKLLSDKMTFEHLKDAATTPGIVAPNDLDVAEKTVQGDRARVQWLRQMEQYLTILSPFDGRVTERNAHPGALLGPAQAAGAGNLPMLRIEQIARLRLLVPVPESYTGGLQEGMQVDFAVSAYPGETFTGVIRRIAQSLEMKTRTMPVELDVDNADRRLAPGMFPEVQWEIHRAHPTLFVPTQAVVTTTEQTFVIRVTQNQTEWVSVKVGQFVGDFVEVFGDLREKDVVVSHATDELRAGTPVNPQPAKSHTPS
jgi:membrane fusion protein (multidrug efflux system)